MSFRVRFLAIIVLSIVMLAATALTFIQLREEGDAAREAAAKERGDAIVAALLQSAARRGIGNDAAALSADDMRSFSEIVDEAIARSPDASAGLCARDGALILARSATPSPPPPGAHPAMDDEHPPPPIRPHADGRMWLPPADRDVAMNACRAAGAVRPAHARRLMPRDLLLASAQTGPGAIAAWSVVRLPPFGTDGARARLRAKFAVMGIVPIILLGLTVSALLGLRRGARDLEASLLRLQDDLRAEVGRPRALELGRIADGLSAMARHLADARAAERALQRRLARDERLAGLGRVVAGVAHEVRNPITGIKLKLDVLARRGLDARSGDDVRTCLQEIARLDRIVSSMLVVARGAPLPEARAEIDLGALLRERIAQAAGLAEQRTVNVRLSGSASLTTSAEALTRVIDNLLRNAIEASPEGSTVDVHIARGHTGVSLTIEDRGPGVPEARLPELYEPFFSTKPEGTGLGLFLSRTLVRGLGAELVYERRDDTTVFAIHFGKEPADG
ncbi:Flagellar sensor histidine kinase FleS [Minicystis rosea]|nr:Flagellar sensor histidine kinase FleS [Minicystis rosea]